MKYSKKFKALNWCCCIMFSFIVLMPSCKHDDLPDLQEEVEPTLAYLLSLGFEQDDLVESQDYYIIEGDMAFKKFDPTDFNHLLNHRSQQYEPGLVDGPEQLEITLSIDSNVPNNDPWRDAFYTAVDAWNALESSLHFTLLGDDDPSADIEVFYHISAFTEGGPYTSALADLPTSSGEPGPRIRLNPMLNVNPPYTQDTYDNAAAHEIGHTLGFWHTDSSNGLLVPGTEEVDTESVMNAARKDWNGFSAGDIMAINYLYPASSLVTGDFTCNGVAGMALRNENYFRIDNNLDGTLDATYHYSSAPDHSEYFIGKWTGGSTKGVAYRNGTTFHYDTNFDGNADGTYTFGSSSAVEYFIGDWNGNGVVSAAYRIGQTFYVDRLGNGSDIKIFTFTNSSAEQYLVGDWDNNGTDTFAYRIGKHFYMDNAFDGYNGGSNDDDDWLRVVLFPGQSVDQYFSGKWSTSGRDGFGAIVGNKFWLDTDFNFFPDIIFTHSY